MKLFTYGTLMRGRSNHELFLGLDKFVGEAELDGYALYDLGYFPGIIAAEGSKVKGEVYEITEKDKKRLDRLESEGYLYKATTVEVTMGEEVVTDVLTYVFLRSVDPKRLVPFEQQPWKLGILGR